MPDDYIVGTSDTNGIPLAPDPADRQSFANRIPVSLSSSTTISASSGVYGDMFSSPDTRRSAGVSCHDVAAYILSKTGPLSAMKLQKLVYYCQACSLVWDERPLFTERIQAWANGPVIPELYTRHRGQFIVESWSWGDPSRLDQAARDTVDAVLEFYGNRSSQWLSDLTHSELPWQLARRGIPVGERADREITLASMSEYYGSL